MFCHGTCYRSNRVDANSIKNGFCADGGLCGGDRFNVGLKDAVAFDLCYVHPCHERILQRVKF